jgi:hypothetical protein
LPAFLEYKAFLSFSILLFSKLLFSGFIDDNYTT